VSFFELPRVLLADHALLTTHWSCSLLSLILPGSEGLPAPRRSPPQFPLPFQAQSQDSALAAVKKKGGLGLQGGGGVAGLGVPVALRQRVRRYHLVDRGCHLSLARSGFLAAAMSVSREMNMHDRSDPSSSRDTEDPSQAAVSYADWILHGRLAPYVREHRIAAERAAMFESAQPAGDMSDPASDSLVLVRGVSDGIRQYSDLGGGLVHSRSRGGDLFLIPPNFATRIEVFDPHLIRALALPIGTLLPLLQDLQHDSNPFDFGRLHLGPFRNDFIVSQYDRLWNYVSRGDVTGRLATEGAILSITAELLNEANRKFQKPRGGLAPSMLRRVTEYMLANLADDLALVTLASLVGLSPFHFCRAFRESTGLPPHR